MKDDVSVEVEVRRPPMFLKSAMKEAGLDPHGISVEVVVYEGSALRELKRVKEDINTLMAPIVALGRDINVRIIADPNLNKSKYKMIIRTDDIKATFEGEYEINEKGISNVMEYSVLRIIMRECKGAVKVL